MSTDLYAIPILLLMLTLSVVSRGQYIVTGQVVDTKKLPVRNVSISIGNSLDGSSSDSLGNFRINISEKGAHLLIVSGIGYKNLVLPVMLSADSVHVLLVLESEYRQLNNIVISAGSFIVGDNNKTLLKPMDIMTTAGANADLFKAIETLPGTQQPGSNTGLFVRGGDASETAVILDEVTVQNPFFSNLPGVSQPGRFAPFQFKGISFSSGGYSARYGQALSSVLELNTLDLPEKSRISVGANFTVLAGSVDKLWAKSSLGFSGSYNNSAIFYKLAKTNTRFYDPPYGDGFSIKYINEPAKDEILKVMLRYSVYKTGIKTPDPFIAGDTANFGISNYTVFSNLSYQKEVNHKWLFYAAASLSFNRDNIHWEDSLLGNIPYLNKDYRAQLRLEAKNYLLANLTLLSGLEFNHLGYRKNFDSLNGCFTENITAVYEEINWSPFNWLSLRPAVRIEQSELLKQLQIQPRFSMAVRAGNHGQFALAYGLFYQDPGNIYLFSGYKPKFQEAIHYIVNYQWIKKERTFRVELYLKDYLHLVREYDSLYDPNPYRFIPAGTRVDNSGYGYAKGAELFWHDKKTIPGLDYWVSYSYTDTKRLYENYLKEATPDFVSTHNLNIVAKYFADALQTNLSITWTYASGRPYYNPTGTGFFADRTPDFQNLAIALGHLTNLKKWFTVIYAGIDNITNHHNIFGYRYSSDGTKKYPVLPAMYRSIILGINLSLSQFEKSEL